MSDCRGADVPYNFAPFTQTHFNAMDEELELIYDDAKEQMGKALEHLAAELLRIRAGKAVPTMLDGVMVEYYGSMSPLKNVATITAPDARSLAIQPFEKGLIQEIEKGIMRANLGFTPQNDGKMVRIALPPLTEERRRDLTKQARNAGEHAKVGIRNVRKDANEQIRALKKDGLPEDTAKSAEEKVQKFTDEYAAKVDVHVADKEKDIMTI